MSWRSELEEKYAVKCKRCGFEKIDPNRKPGQKYMKNEDCPMCKNLTIKNDVQK